jgi:hypothetical protein
LLPTATEKVWDFLRTQPALAGFVLVGGSALALRIHHRRSEDLDLAFGDTHLPRTRLEALQRIAEQTAVDFQRSDDEAALQEFALAGLELHDYQQNFIVDGSVRVSFFVPDAALAKVLKVSQESGVRVAALEELFKSKCLVSALRSKTRDWLDLYVLMRGHGFSIGDFLAAFREAGIEAQCDSALSRLCSGVPQRDDEGYAHLLADPPSLEEMKAFFRTQRDKLEIETAAEALRRRRARDSQNGRT